MIALVKTSGPVIGISGSSADSASVKAMIRQVIEAGGTPLLLANHAGRTAAEDLQKIDALMVMGNNADINPEKYGAAKDPHTKSEDDSKEGAARSQYEEELLARTVAMKMPVLGVCGGMQRINILCGGTLHQHVPDLVGHNEHSQQEYKVDGYIPVQPVFLGKHGKDTTLSSIAAGITSIYAPGHDAPPLMLLENSMHHQAVNVVGEGLRPAAFSDDKVKLPDGRDSLLIEAIEADPNGKFKDQTLLGVQWHPEFGASPLGERITGFMVNKAKEYARQTGREHTQAEVVRENFVSSLPANIPAPRPGSMTEMVLRRRMESPAAGLAI
ncbi:MAG: gamma-glutamyl-gamma-aminobutyrate hydrolase family protein [Rickettsiales bacterium]|nr:gamma-glutamyl-gamma-aminobutyrate hydrolase family protein [Rickettsiales bacterium]